MSTERYAGSGADHQLCIRLGVDAHLVPRTAKVSPPRVTLMRSCLHVWSTASPSRPNVRGMLYCITDLRLRSLYELCAGIVSRCTRNERENCPGAVSNINEHLHLNTSRRLQSLEH